MARAAEERQQAVGQRLVASQQLAAVLSSSQVSRPLWEVQNDTLLSTVQTWTLHGGTRSHEGVVDFGGEVRGHARLAHRVMSFWA